MQCDATDPDNDSLIFTYTGYWPVAALTALSTLYPLMFQSDCIGHLQRSYSWCLLTQARRQHEPYGGILK